VGATNLGPGRRIVSRTARQGVSRFGGQAGTQAPDPTPVPPRNRESRAGSSIHILPADYLRFLNCQFMGHTGAKIICSAGREREIPVGLDGARTMDRQAGRSRSSQGATADLPEGRRGSEQGLGNDAGAWFSSRLRSSARLRRRIADLGDGLGPSTAHPSEMALGHRHRLGDGPDRRVCMIAAGDPGGRSDAARWSTRQR
jgi:hypothetical protein